MLLQDKIHEEMVEAMKAKEEVRLRVLRGLISLFTQELTSTKRTPQDKLKDDDVLALIRRSVKQRKDASEQFKKGGRDDLAKNEDEERIILEKYLPKMMDKSDIEKVVVSKIDEMGVTDKSGMGKLIGAVMSELKGKADGSVVKEIIENKLS